MFELRVALFLLLSLLGLAGVVALYVLRDRRRRAVWDTFGQWHGLALADDELVLAGSLEGHPLRVLTQEREDTHSSRRPRARRGRSVSLVRSGTYEVEELLKDEEVREQLRSLAASALSMSVRNGWLQAEFDGVPATAEELEGLVLQVLETPRALQAAVQRFHLRRPRLS